MGDNGSRTSNFGPVVSRVVTTVAGIGDALSRRHAEENENRTTLEKTLKQAEAEYAARTRDAAAVRDAALAAAREACDARVAELRQAFESEHRETRTRVEVEHAKLKTEASDEKSTIERDAREAVWLCDAVAESDQRQIDATCKALRDSITEIDKSLQDYEAQRQQIAQDYGPRGRRHLDESPASARGVVDQSVPTDGLEATTFVEASRQAADDADELLSRWANLLSPRLAYGGGFVVLALVLIAGLGAAGWFFHPELNLDWEPWMTAAIGAAIGVVLALPLKLILGHVAAKRINDLGDAISSGLRTAWKNAAIADHLGRAVYEADRGRVLGAREEEIKRIEQERRQRLDALQDLVTTRGEELRHELESGSARLQQERDTGIRAAEEQRAQVEESTTATFDHNTTDAREHREQVVAAARKHAEDHFAELTAWWSERSRELITVSTSLQQMREEIAPDFDSTSWEGWVPSTHYPECVPIAALPVILEELPGGLSDDERLPWYGPRELRLPIALEFPRVGSLIIETDAEGREAALELARQAMLRLLTALPTGKIRLTVVDPVGLGQNFAAFMHLADHEERLITGRIWTDARHIEERLTDLTEHMERVIQKYLRNEFQSIEDYNVQAGEIAEPYRFLVLADFPTNLSDVAASKLASIVESGARCGVHVIVIADLSRQPPNTIALDDLRRASVVIQSTAKGIALRRPELTPSKVDPPALPSEDRTTHLLNAVGLSATDSTRVHVPFSAVTPSAENFWSRSAAQTIRIPLGRQGATRLQELELGAGTMQHALIAGKTGSGKSTLLHVLITNAALWYSPDELELYLVDFKKGVEFRTYARHYIPHARVVAIETDREFGLSVLRRLDEELTRRGESFRDLGVQSLPDYRTASGKPMPRTLLVIDEFQELFVEDDTVAQESSLLLDRLVRQGRAFGMHVLLGSQTLGGAYSITRTTMGQMNVRIALQCDEQDSYHILSEDNAAARLLERPGEAIYNNAAGRVEGNSPFQIVWLPSAERDAALNTVDDLSSTRGLEPRETIVFEGNVPADPARNAALVVAAAPPSPVDPVRLYLGEPTAIAKSTAVELRRQGGANVIAIGQRSDAAHAITSMAAVSFAAQQAANPGAQLVMLDGTPPDAPDAIQGLAELATSLPVDSRTGRPADAEGLLLEVAAELKRRQDTESSAEPPILILIHALQRFRDLRRSDDFSFSMSDDDGEPAHVLFARILEQGPEVGIHVMTWCDSVTNMERTLERRTLHEFDQRIVFQMSVMDSTALIDSPLASRLGPNRAILWNDEESRASTFRPYAAPGSKWLRTLFAASSSDPVSG